MDKPESCADELPKKEGEQVDFPKRCWTYGPVTHRLREESRQATSSGKPLAVPATAGELLAEPALSEPAEVTCCLPSQGSVSQPDTNKMMGAAAGTNCSYKCLT